jgi:hypothetical protein
LKVFGTGMEICGLSVRSPNTIVVVGNGRIVTRDLYTSGHHLGGWEAFGCHLLATAFGRSGLRLYASVSLHLNRIVVRGDGCFEEDLRIYDMSTGKRLAGARSESKGHMLGFTTDTHQVWCATADGEVDQWEIVKRSDDTVPEQEYLRRVEPRGEFPWQSSRGHQVTDDGWIITSRGERLLWLPHHWRSGKTARRWKGNHLALLHGELPEPVVLELLGDAV